MSGWNKNTILKQIYHPRPLIGSSLTSCERCCPLPTSISNQFVYIVKDSFLRDYQGAAFKYLERHLNARRSLHDILHLLANLFDQHLEINRAASGF